MRQPGKDWHDARQSSVSLASLSREPLLGSHHRTANQLYKRMLPGNTNCYTGSINLTTTDNSAALAGVARGAARAPPGHRRRAGNGGTGHHVTGGVGSFPHRPHRATTSPDGSV